MAETGLGDVAGIPKLGSNWSIILHSLISTGQLGGAGAGVGTKLEISIGQSPSEHWAINRTNYNFLPSPHPLPLGRIVSAETLWDGFSIKFAEDFKSFDSTRFHGQKNVTKSMLYAHEEVLI